MLIFLNGKFVDRKKAMVAVFDHGFLYGDGVFETLRAYSGKVWNIDAHVARLLRGSRLMKMPLPWTKKQICRWIEETVVKNKLKEAVIRLTVTRGENNFDFMNVKNPTICIVASQNKPWPMAYYTKGISAITTPLERSYPAVKTTSLIANTRAQQQMAAKKCQEAFFINRRGHISEGTRTNVFFVKNGALTVPRDEALSGTTKKLTMQLARKMKMKIHEKPIRKEQIHRMDECFITSVTRRIMPVVKIDGKAIGKGIPGLYTKRLAELLDRHIARKLRIPLL